jgi:hypothetical protein
MNPFDIAVFYFSSSSRPETVATPRPFSAPCSLGPLFPAALLLASRKERIPYDA